MKETLDYPGVGKMGFFAPTEFWDELLRSARLALKAEEFLRAHGEMLRDCCGSFAYEPGKRTGALEGMRAVFNLSKEFGL